MLWRTCFALAGLLAGALAGDVDSCPGYRATSVKTSSTGLTAKLKLNGKSCNAYGKDLDDLLLQVEYQTDSRLHVKIYDSAMQVYQVPEEILKAPKSDGGSASKSALKFHYTEKPFSFSVVRSDNNETIFDTHGSNIIFESQYLRLRTKLPKDPNVYGLGEDSDAFRRNTTNYTRTLWSRDAFGTPSGTNLYGNHPVYFEHRPSSNETHGVFLLNSNGMDIKIDNNDKDGQFLEYNTIGGVLDLYFLAGPGPVDVAKQYSDIVGKPAMQPYWGLGFHQCRFGYHDYIDVAEVVLNYSRAGIPLETMWTDIDYMDKRKVFTLDPERFPLHKMRELVDYLHKHDQQYIVMVDPAVAHADYGPFNRGKSDGIFLKEKNGDIYKGVVWPGVTSFPDWFNPKTQDYWNGEFGKFFDADSGLDIDALWIDMNEASNFCPWPCSNPEQFAKDGNFPPAAPPVKTTWPPLPGFPSDFQPPHSKRSSGGNMKGLPGRNLTDPLYKINNAAGSLSNLTLKSSLIHSNGLAEYDTHNAYGTMMSMASRDAMISRRPTKRPMIITRSTFAGAGAKVGHWLGDNLSDWEHYRNSIAQIMAFAGLYQIPLVGADVCGFGSNTTETLCARWARLGAFYPFFRNHNIDNGIPQEFYRWEKTTSAAKKAIETRYKMLDYLYTAMHAQSTDGTPTLSSIWMQYPTDANAVSVDNQFFFGPSVLVSPVTQENATDVDIYLPKDVFYDFYTGAKVQGAGKTVHLSDVDFDEIPVHVRGGAILPLRANSANTTKALREEDFELVVAPGKDGSASGSLYLDDGESLEQGKTSLITFTYKGGMLQAGGQFGYETKNKVKKITVLGKKGSKSVDESLMKGWKVKC